MRIGVDVMGGDHAPDAILDGALAAFGQLQPDDELVLVGDPEVIGPALDRFGTGRDRVELVPATQVIRMDEPPVEAVRLKPGSSITVLAALGSARKAERLGRRPCDAVLSAGNTGAFISAVQMHMRRLRYVNRPGIAVVLPTFLGPSVLIDVGANIQPKPQHLAQYGVMGEVYARLVLGIDRPRVALMNVGGEEQKGTDEMKRARDMLRAAEGLDFIGYIEGRAVFDGGADVIIADGVVGNVMLKLAEGLSEGIFRAIAREVGAVDPELAQRFEPIVKRIYAQHDYHEYGGAPLLGVRGVCLISHGASEARTIANAILRARHFVESGVNDAISRRLGALEEAVA
jgi:glycerol-3-phosphate acyltransferase PlsX